MRTYFIAISITLLCSFCSPRQKSEDSTTVIDTASLHSQIVPTVSHEQMTLRDTTINGVKLKFIELAKRHYDSLFSFVIETKIPLEKFDHLVSKTKNCQLIKLANDIDSLCDVSKNESGYFEKYEIKGLWKKKELLLANSQDWEGGGDYLISLKSKFHYYLNTNYEISPSTEFIIGYNPDNVIPIYGNEFVYSEMSNGSVKTLFNIDLGSIVITGLNWLRNDQCLIASALQYIDTDEFKLKNHRYYLMTIGK